MGVVERVSAKIKSASTVSLQNGLMPFYVIRLFSDLSPVSLQNSLPPKKGIL
jgi:hypothetical protein